MADSPALPSGTGQLPGESRGADKASWDAERPDPKACVDSHYLLGGRKAIDILHNGLTYRLQATRLGKLILTK